MENITIDSNSCILSPIRYLPSPHHDERPSNTAIDTIIVHNISLPPGQFGSKSIEQFFQGTLDFSTHPYFESIKTLRVSSHLLIDRQGTLVQFVPFLKRAWHAGVSTFAGRQQCNDFSIGIELEGTDDLAYEKVQYHKLAAIIQLLMQYYPGITRERVVGHSEVAPMRKTDPGPSFDWQYLHSLL